MIKYISGAWRRLLRSQPGRRFQDQKEYLSGGQESLATWRRALAASLGVALIIAGVALLPLPGPGGLVILLGLVLVSQSTTRVGAFLDRTELRLREIASRGRAWWVRASVAVRLGSIVVPAALAVLGAYLVYRWLFV